MMPVLEYIDRISDQCGIRELHPSDSRRASMTTILPMIRVPLLPDTAPKWVLSHTLTPLLGQNWNSTVGELSPFFLHACLLRNEIDKGGISRTC